MLQDESTTVVDSYVHVYDGSTPKFTASETGGSPEWSQNYLYDQYGNRAVQPGGYIPNPNGTPTATSQFTNNRWMGAGATYDAAGGATAIPGTMNESFTYDAEYRVNTANANGTITYLYDGEGRRYQKIASTFWSFYIYDTFGKVIQETTVPAPGTSFPTNGPFTGTEYVIGDHLGSTRLAVNNQGQVVERYDFLPFGEELTAGVGGRGSDYEPSGYTYPTTPDTVLRKFTGKERDAESGLDFFGARYMSSAQGRFTSPDPLNWQDWQHGDKQHRQLFADFISNPQNFNQYAYVLNNPLGSTDPSGLYTCQGTEQECKNVEAQLVDGRKSDNQLVSRGAAAYGAAGVDNGVHVSFSDQKTSGNASTGFETDGSGKISGISVVFSAGQFSNANAAASVTAGATVVHEGSHVADDQAYILNTVLVPGLPSAADITHFQSEVGAYLTGAAFIAQHGGRQGSPTLPGVGLDSQGTIGIFLHVAPSGNPPYRAYPDSVLRSPISQ